MKKLLLLLTLQLMLASCSSAGTDKYLLKLYSNEADAKAMVNDSLYSLPAKVLVNRHDKSLQVKLVTDSLRRDYTLLTEPGWDKRNYKGAPVYFDTRDTATVVRAEPKLGGHWYFRRDPRTFKGRLNLNLSLPFVNNFYQQPVGEGVSYSTGFIGGSIGLEYYYSKSRFINATVGAGLNYEYPFPVPFSDDYGSNHNALYLSLSHNHQQKVFTFGYGLNYSVNGWNWSPGDSDSVYPNTRTAVSKYSRSLGFLANAYFRVGKHFHLGLNYRPSLLNVHPETEFKYQHIISLDFLWKITLNRK